MSSVMNKALDKMARELFCDFLTIAIHGLLHSRKVYSHGVFKLRQKFTMPVQVCYHPDVFNYITQLVQEIGEVLRSRALHAIHVFIVPSSTSAKQEQFTFKLHSFNDVTTQDQLMSLERELRAALLKLAIVESYLPTAAATAASTVSWKVEIDASNQQLETETAWYRMGNLTNQKPGTIHTDNSKKIIPLKTICTDAIKLELYVKA